MISICVGKNWNASLKLSFTQGCYGGKCYFSTVFVMSKTDSKKPKQFTTEILIRQAI